MFRSTTIETIRGKGLSAESPDQDLKKAYYSAAGSPLTGDKLAQLRAALNGDTSLIQEVTETAAAPAKAPKAKKEKAAKAPKEAAAPNEPKAVKPSETADQALARLKADPATSTRWARVQSVLEMGKRGPTRVRIVCDDKGEGGADLFRDIAVQDLFQVRFSAGYAKKHARKNRVKSNAKAAAAEAPAATA
jgi:hypothetical protein